MRGRTVAAVGRVPAAGMFASDLIVIGALSNPLLRMLIWPNCPPAASRIVVPAAAPSTASWTLPPDGTLITTPLDGGGWGGGGGGGAGGTGGAGGVPGLTISFSAS